MTLEDTYSGIAISDGTQCKLWAGQLPACYLFPPVSASSTLTNTSQQAPSVLLSRTLIFTQTEGVQRE